MSKPIDKPCGWSGFISDFLTLSKDDWLNALQKHHQRCMNCSADQSQLLAWDHEFDLLTKELKQLLQVKSIVGTYTIIFEYELPRERGRRPDVIILGSSIFVIEFKDYANILQAHIDQAAAYARDLRSYHAASQQSKVVPILVLARAKDMITLKNDVIIISPDRIADIFYVESKMEIGSFIDPAMWIAADYSPLPSLIQAARIIWEKQPLPQIKRAQSAGIPHTIAELIRIAQVAQTNNQLHLALVTGVPGAGKTLVRIQLVYESHLEQSEKENIAIFLSGNGPLIKVLQYALKNSIFVKDVHGF
jgi:hypothetical protein